MIPYYLLWIPIIVTPSRRTQAVCKAPVVRLPLPASYDPSSGALLQQESSYKSEAVLFSGCFDGLTGMHSTLRSTRKFLA